MITVSVEIIIINYIKTIFIWMFCDVQLRKQQFI